MVPKQDCRLPKHRHHELQQFVERRPCALCHFTLLLAGPDTLRYVSTSRKTPQLFDRFRRRRKRRRTDYFECQRHDPIGATRLATRYGVHNRDLQTFRDVNYLYKFLYYVLSCTKDSNFYICMQLDIFYLVMYSQFRILTGCLKPCLANFSANGEM
uniref:Uncharacterized protein n=1 Tax=Photinus pyralis TaxID=7054 RepID=A0A1Y1K128_PHOPY